MSRAAEGEAQGRRVASDRVGVPPDSSALARRLWLRWLATVGAAEGAFLAAHVVSGSVSLSPLLAYGVGFAAVTATAIATSCTCPLLPRRALALAAGPALALLLLSLFTVRELDVALIVTAALLLGGTLVGSAVGAAITHPGHLLFVAIVSAAADMLSVFHPNGPSAAIAQSQQALSLLALPWPMLGTPNIEPFLGVGDIVFTALYIASSRRHALPLARTVLALTLGYAVTMVCVIASEASVPALPLLGFAFVLVQPRARRPPLHDRTRGYVIAAVVVAVVVVLMLH